VKFFTEGLVSRLDHVRSGAERVTRHDAMAGHRLSERQAVAVPTPPRRAL